MILNPRRSPNSHTPNHSTSIHLAPRHHPRGPWPCARLLPLPLLRPRRRRTRRARSRRRGRAGGGNTTPSTQTPQGQLTAYVTQLPRKMFARDFMRDRINSSVGEVKLADYRLRIIHRHFLGINRCVVVHLGPHCLPRLGEHRSRTRLQARVPFRERRLPTPPTCIAVRRQCKAGTEGGVEHGSMFENV